MNLEYFFKKWYKYNVTFKVINIEYIWKYKILTEEQCRILMTV